VGDEPAWRTTWQNTVQCEDDLVRFVNDVGCCTIGPLERWPNFPSQGVAMGLRDVLGTTWFWKDDLHTEKRLFYTRLFAGRPGFISYAMLPVFIASSGEVADELVHYGKLPATTCEILRVIEEHGPIATRKLKKLLGSDACRAANAALIDLERRFIVTKTDIAGRTLGTYSYIWDLAERWIPDAFVAADRIKRKAAREQVMSHLTSHSIDPNPTFLTRVLRWTEL